MEPNEFGFTPASDSPFNVESNPEDITLGDVNNDGNVDILTANVGSKSISVLLGDGDGNFTPAPTIPDIDIKANISSGDQLALDDFDGDGNLDLVVATRLDLDNNNNFALLLGDGTGNFGAPTNLSAGALITKAVTTGDFNLDGNQDIAFSADTVAGKVSVVLGDGNGGFAAPTIFPDIGVNADHILSTDLNGDDIEDLVVTTDVFSGEDFGVTVLLGNGADSNLPLFSDPVRFTTGNPGVSKATSAVVGDFNNDGNPDLALANNSPGNFSILLGDGNGGFGTPTTFDVGAEVRFLAVEDFNGDNNEDLAVTTSGGTSIQIGDGNGSFQEALLVPDTESNIGDIVAADFNGDEKPDFALVENLGSGSDDVTVLLNSPPATPPLVDGENPDVVFIVDISDSTTDPFEGTPVGDLNGDGVADTILDAEIAGFTALNQELSNPDLNEETELALIAFSSEANQVGTIVQPLTDEDPLNGTPDIEDALTSLQNSGGTNFEAALQAAETVFQDLETQSGDGNVIFLSDGFPFPADQDFTDEVERLQALDINLRAFGVGSSSSLSDLQTIDPNATIFTNTDQLLDVFSNISMPNE